MWRTRNGEQRLADNQPGGDESEGFLGRGPVSVDLARCSEGATVRLTQKKIEQVCQSPPEVRQSPPAVRKSPPAKPKNTGEPRTGETTKKTCRDRRKQVTKTKTCACSSFILRHRNLVGNGSKTEEPCLTVTTPHFLQWV